MSHLENGERSTRLRPQGCNLATLGPAEPWALWDRTGCLGPCLVARKYRAWCFQWLLLGRPWLTWRVCVCVCGSVGKVLGLTLPLSTVLPASHTPRSTLTVSRHSGQGDLLQQEANHSNYVVAIFPSQRRIALWHKEVSSLLFINYLLFANGTLINMN